MTFSGISSIYRKIFENITATESIFVDKSLNASSYFDIRNYRNFK